MLQILLDRGPGGARHAAGAGWPLGVDALIEIAGAAYGDTLRPPPPASRCASSSATRLRGLLIDDGLAAQDVDVALGVSADDPCDARMRARAVAVVPQVAREVFKRIANILDDARAKQHLITGDGQARGCSPRPTVREARLWSAFCARQDRLQAALDHHQYRDSFAVLAELGPDVAAFFDEEESW